MGVSVSGIFTNTAVVGVACLAMQSWAAGIDAKTTYDIRNDRVTTTTVYKKAPTSLDAKFREKFWEQVRTKLKQMPFVDDVQTGSITETKEDPGKWYDYTTLKRKFSAFVQMNINQPVTMLFQVEETNRLCRPLSAEAKAANAFDEYPPAPCQQMNSTIDIKGPIAVYGTHETKSNLPGLMRDKQHITITISRSSDDLTLESQLSIDSMGFEKSLFGFVDDFNIPLATHQNSVGINAAIARAAEALTRQSIFLGAARIMRQNNERILEL